MWWKARWKTNKEDEAEGVNEEAEVEISHRHESTPVCVLKVEEGPVTGWTEQLMIEYYFQLSAATSGRLVKEWMMRDRIPNLKKEDKKKKLYKKKDKYGNQEKERGVHAVNCIRSL